MLAQAQKDIKILIFCFLACPFCFIVYFIYQLIYLYQYKLIFFKQLEVFLCLFRYTCLTLTVWLPVLLRYWILRFCRLNHLCFVIMRFTERSLLLLLRVALLASLSIFTSLILILTPPGLFFALSLPGNPRVLRRGREFSATACFRAIENLRQFFGLPVCFKVYDILITENFKEIRAPDDALIVSPSLLIQSSDICRPCHSSFSRSA